MWKLDSKKSGLDKILTPYQAHILKCLAVIEPGLAWDNKELWDSCLEHGIKISRASVIFFTRDIAKDGLVDAIPITGKGGKTFAYKTSKTMIGIENHIISRLIQNIDSVFPRTALKDVIHEL